MTGACEHEWLLISESTYFPSSSTIGTPSTHTLTTKAYKCTKCGKLFQ